MFLVFSNVPGFWASLGMAFLAMACLSTCALRPTAEPTLSGPTPGRTSARSDRTQWTAAFASGSHRSPDDPPKKQLMIEVSTTPLVMIFL